VLGFRSSDNLGAAYGIAVSGMMAITTGLAFLYMRGQGWNLALAVPVFAAFGLVDLAFFGANLLKIAEGGWFPIVVAALVFAVMATWWRGRRLLTEKRARDALQLRDFVDALRPDHPTRIPGTAIFMTRDLEHVPLALLHALKHYKVLHQRVVMMQVETEDVPHVPEEQRLNISELGKGFYAIRLRYGFTDQPNVVRALAQCRIGGLRFNLMETSFIIGREKLRARPRRAAFWRWRDRLFIVMSNNMLDATEFFRIPPNRVVELGGQIEI
jgi:KUP system potassium uptake protein